MVSARHRLYVRAYPVLRWPAAASGYRLNIGLCIVSSQRSASVDDPLSRSFSATLQSATFIVLFQPNPPPHVNGEHRTSAPRRQFSFAQDRISLSASQRDVNSTHPLHGFPACAVARPPRCLVCIILRFPRDVINGVPAACHRNCSPVRYCCCRCCCCCCYACATVADASR
jgi:hypothetical protein